MRAFIRLLFFGVIFISNFVNSDFVKSGETMISKNFLSSCMGVQKKAGENMAKQGVFVQKKVLSNGMTILVREVHNTPSVSAQLFINVGSKDETTGNRGIAHLIEHMAFKGTKKLSETDVIAVMQKLSGSCNAFTSYDYTGYMFNLPTQNWKESLPIISEFMTSCSFKDDLLNSELKAVIQEMKMGKDNYMRYIIFEMLTLIFPDHPYHYPIIGHKQDLWSVAGADLLEFHKKHYLPNNSVLVVVGDVDAQDVFDEAEKYLGKIPSDPTYKKEKFYFNRDISSKTLMLYRDIKQPVVLFAFVIPGAMEKNEHIVDAVELILGKGKSSRLYRKLVDELKLVSDFSADSVRLFEHGVLFFTCEPKDLNDIDLNKIQSLICSEIDSIVQNGVTEKEIERAINKTKMSCYSKLEDIQSQAYDIGCSFLALDDENYPFTFLNNFSSKTAEEVQKFCSDYLRKAVMHKGLILPLEESEKEEWKILQDLSDQEDKNILYSRVRNTPLEGPKYANDIEANEPVKFNFPKAKTFDLSNGVKVLYHENKNTPKINLILELRAKHYYDPDGMQGLYNFLASVMTEGTKNYTASELADEIESRGMSLCVSPGSISMSMLSEDLPKGIEILEEILTRPALEKKEVEKVREQILTEIKNFWDDPASISSQLTKENIYKGHPYRKNILGTEASVKKIRRKDLKKFHEKYISPFGAKLSIVGDFSGNNLKKVLEQKLSKWSGHQVQEMVFPTLDVSEKKCINYNINRDQVVLSMACLSVDRKNKDYDKFLLFDQIFGGGVLGTMHSRLFHLREKTGMFYTIAGSSIANSGKQPGIAIVRTIVSLDKLNDAENIIKEAIDKTADSITTKEFELANQAIVNSLNKNFETNKKIAQVFLFLEKYDLPSDYFDNRAKQLSKISLEDVKSAVSDVMQSKNMIVFRVGRVGDVKA